MRVSIVRNASVVLIAFSLFISYSYLAHGDHYSEEYIQSETVKIDAAFEADEMSKEEYGAKIDSLTESHSGQRDDAVNNGDRKRKSAPISTLVAVAVGIIVYMWYRHFSRRRLIQRMRLQESQVNVGANRNVEVHPVRRVDVEERGWLSSMLRDKSRDEICNGLRDMGLNVTMADRGRAEEKIRAAFFGGSLGLIDVVDDLVKWINVVRTKRRDRNGPARYRIVFGIPDNTIPVNHKALKIKTVRKKSFPVFGKVIDVHWEANGSLSPLVSVFTDDDEVESLVKEVGDVSVYTHPHIFQGWTLEVATTGKAFEPTSPHWHVIQKIGHYLISSPR